MLTTTQRKRVLSAARKWEKDESTGWARGAYGDYASATSVCAVGALWRYSKMGTERIYITRAGPNWRSLENLNDWTCNSKEDAIRLLRTFAIRKSSRISELD